MKLVYYRFSNPPIVQKCRGAPPEIFSVLPAWLSTSSALSRGSSLKMRATRFLLVSALSAPSSWFPPPFCVEGLAAASATAFVAAARTSTSTPRGAARCSGQRVPRPGAQPWAPRPADKRRGSVIAGRAGLRAASTGGDDAVSVRTAPAPAEAPDSAKIEEGHSPPPGKLVGPSSSPRLGAYWDILRPQNIPSSFGLVAAGALVASHTVGSMLDPKVSSSVLIGGVI